MLFYQPIESNQKVQFNYNKLKGGFMKRYLGIWLMICLLSVSQSGVAMSSPVQWKIEDGGNGHWYEAIPVPSGITWTNANLAAQSQAGDWHLATLTLASENSFVLGLFQDNSSFWSYGGHSSLVGDVYTGPWIGGLKVGGSWAWVTGEAFNYSFWGPYEPFGNGDRIDYSKLGATTGWNDIYSTVLVPGYIIETSSAPVPVPPAAWLLGSCLVGLMGLRRKFFTK